MKELTNLERLLRGDEATYFGYKVLKTLDFRKDNPKDDKSIIIIYIKNDISTDLWFSKRKVNNHSEIKFQTPSKPRAIEDGLKYGDIIVDKNGEKRKILAVIDEVIIPSGFSNFEITGSYFTLQELIKLRYKLETQTEQKAKKMTVADVEKLVGTKVEIVKE